MPDGRILVGAGNGTGGMLNGLMAGNIVAEIDVSVSPVSLMRDHMRYMIPMPTFRCGLI